MAEPPENMVDPDGRECRCENCGRVEWVNGLLAPTVGIVCDVCRRSPCPQCDGPMRPVHRYVRQAFENGVTNAPSPQPEAGEMSTSDGLGT